MADADPVVGNWYRHLDKGQEFEVVALSLDGGTVGVQHFDGDLESFDLDDWYNLPIEPIEAPENWTGPLDDVDAMDIQLQAPKEDEPDWNAPLDEFHRAEDQDAEQEREWREPFEAEGPAPDETEGTIMASTELSKLDQEFVTKAAMDGVAEIEMAKLAKKKAVSPKLRDFADMMLTDHSKAKNKLQKMADSMGIVLPHELSSEHRKMIDDFDKYDGADFEDRFLAAVLDEHQKDVNLYHAESDHGRNEDIKNYAAEIAPILEKHLDMAQSLTR